LRAKSVRACLWGPPVRARTRRPACLRLKSTDCHAPACIGLLGTVSVRTTDAKHIEVEKRHRSCAKPAGTSVQRREAQRFGRKVQTRGRKGRAERAGRERRGRERQGWTDAGTTGARGEGCEEKKLGKRANSKQINRRRRPETRPRLARMVEDDVVQDGFKGGAGKAEAMGMRPSRPLFTPARRRRPEDLLSTSEGRHRRPRRRCQRLAGSHRLPQMQGPPRLPLLPSPARPLPPDPQPRRRPR
jgi:hypothetical protein